MRAASVLLAACGGLLLSHAPARAQGVDVNPAPPNVLLLLDTSGSMERMIDGRDPDLNVTYSLPSGCVPGTATEPNRWGVALMALSGDIEPFFSCARMPRNTGTPFDDEYSMQVGGTRYRPYDIDYFLPFHRPVSSNSGVHCAYGPWQLPGAAAGDGVGAGIHTAQSDTTINADRWGQNSLGTWPLANAPANPGVTIAKGAGTQCTFRQANNGFIDQGRDIVRFGLMTFDQDPRQGLGVNVSGTNLRVTTPFFPTAPQCGAIACPGTGQAPVGPFDGQWSYFPNWDGQGGWATIPVEAAWGKLNACDRVQFDVGARSPAAPPWEGRMVKFPGSTASVRDLQRNNDRIKAVINASRPYGATPILGMMKDAQDYFWQDPDGPNGASPGGDPYVKLGCRKQYIVLLTDGAPNLDLRPQCAAGGSTTPPTPAGTHCPYWRTNEASAPATTAGVGKTARDIAWDLYNARYDTTLGTFNPSPGGTYQQVTTFVIGFAVSGNNPDYVSTFPAPYNVSPFNRCTDFARNTQGPTSAGLFPASCSNTSVVLPGSAAEACCELEQIARAGQGQNPTLTNGTLYAYFADDAASLQSALAAILGQIASGTTTRALPAYAPPSTQAGLSSDIYFAQFQPQKTGPWKGSVYRRKLQCTGTLDPYTINTDDDFQANTNTGASSSRRFISVVPANSLTGSLRDGENTIRPYYPSADPDGAGTYSGNEVGGTWTTFEGAVPADALNMIDDMPGPTSSACRGSRRFGVGGTTISSLTAVNCKRVALGFATANDPAVGGGWTLPAERDGAGADTARLGGIFHSSPSVVPPPNALLRDDSYLAFKGDVNFAGRKQMLYVETTDGLLHGFETRPATAAAAQAPAQLEQFAFIPPMVLPRLRSNYKGGQMNLLDGTPVVQDVTFARSPGSIGGWNTNWRTVLVSGCGRAGCGGYFAMDVTRGDFATFTAAAPNPGVPPAQSTLNPHFLWQLTTVPAAAGETRAGIRNDKAGNKQMALFGRETGIPAITTVFLDNTGDRKGDIEVGIAILPGGVDGPPKGVGASPYCPRATFTGQPYGAPNLGGASPFGFAWDTARKYWDFRPVTNHTARSHVRKWGTTCADAVPGRSVTIVRLDTGEILKVFARYGTGSGDAFNEAPQALAVSPKFRVNDTPLDSPMTGTPIVFPAGVGSVGKYFYIGDADGTIWKFDISDPNPDYWKGGMFYDMYNVEALTADAAAAGVTAALDTADERAEASQPVEVLPTLSFDSTGATVLHAATGDLENFTSKHFRAADLDESDPDDRDDERNKEPIFNYLVAIREQLSPNDKRLHAFNNDDLGQSPPLAPKTWRHFMTNGERVAGPMTVFDRYIYYVTWQPASSPACNAAAGNSVVYGRHYLSPHITCGGTGTAGCGGAWAPGFTATGSIVVNAANFPTMVPAPDGKLVPGLALQQTPACTTYAAVTDTSYVGGSYTAGTTTTSGTYTLSLPIAGGSGGAGGTQLGNITLATPQTATRIDAWATVID